MKRILGAVSITIGIGTTVLAGLVADDGIGITAPPAQPVIEKIVVPVVEEKGAPPPAMPEIPAKPEVSEPEAPEPTPEPEVTEPEAEKPQVTEPKAEEPKAEEPKTEEPKAEKTPEEARTAEPVKTEEPPPPATPESDAAKTPEVEAPAPAADAPAEVKGATEAEEEDVVVSEPEKAEMDSAEATAAAAAAPVQKTCESGKLSKHGEKAFFVAAGRSRGSVEAIALGLEFFSSSTWFNDGNWYCIPYLELLVGYWEGDPGHTGNSSLHEGGASGYIRCIHKKQPGSAIRPYADAGLGLHYITENRIEGKELGRQWLAGSNVGVGLVLGESERVDVGLRVRHLSNGGTSEINWGINHYMLRVALRF